MEFCHVHVMNLLAASFQVFSLFDDFAFGKVLKLVKDTLCIGGKAQTSHRGRPADVGEEYSEDEANEDTMEDDLENCASASKILEW